LNVSGATISNQRKPAEASVAARRGPRPQTVLVAGLGGVGSLVAEMLASADYRVSGVDLAPAADLPIETTRGDLSDVALIRGLLDGVDLVVSCLPYHLTRPVMEATVAKGVHYLDLTEDRYVTAAALALGPEARAAVIPQCGLAPGYVSIVGADLVRRLDSVRSLRLRVGALPQKPTGSLGYSFTWSPAGVMNQYLNVGQALRDGQPTEVPSLTEHETVTIDGTELEAFSTSGGLGTLCDTYRGVISELNYKTLRYPGHCFLMRFFLHELQMKQDRKEAARILARAAPPVHDDVVFLHAVADGVRDGREVSEEVVRVYRSGELLGRHRRAIASTTAAGVCSVVELLTTGQVPSKGFVRQEEIERDLFESTRFGAFFA
jgi:saccharopine dehydrogenase-like NADP-dependent oxidoreductase